MKFIPPHSWPPPPLVLGIVGFPMMRVFYHKFYAHLYLRCMGTPPTSQQSKPYEDSSWWTRTKSEGRGAAAAATAASSGGSCWTIYRCLPWTMNRKRSHHLFRLLFHGQPPLPPFLALGYPTFIFGHPPEKDKLDGLHVAALGGPSIPTGRTSCG